MSLKIRRALGVTFALQALATLGASAFQVLSARWLGTAGRGQLAMLVSASQIVAMIAGLGLPGAISFYAAAQPRSIPLLTRRELALIGFVGVLLGCGLVTNRLLSFYDLLIGMEVWFALHTLGNVAQPAFASLTLASGAVLASNATAVVTAVGASLGLAALASSGHRGLGVAFGSLAVASVVGAGLGLGAIARRGGLRPAQTQEPSWAAQLRVAGLGFASNLIGLLMFRADVFLVAALGGGDRAAGLYSIGVVTAEILVRLPNWTATVLAPSVSAHPEEGCRVTVALFWANVAFAVLATSPILVLPDTMRWLLGVVVGRDFVASYSVLVAMVPRIVVQAGGAIVFGNLVGQGYSVHHPMACGVGLVVLFCADWLLIPRFGVVGAAAGSGIGYLAAALVAFRGFLSLNRISLRDFAGLSRTTIDGWLRTLRGRVGSGGHLPD